MLSVFHPFRICAYMLDSFISSSTTFCISSYGSQSASTNNTSEGPSNSQVVLLTSSHLRFFLFFKWPPTPAQICVRILMRAALTSWKTRLLLLHWLHAAVVMIISWWDAYMIKNYTHLARIIIILTAHVFFCRGG